MLKSLGKLRKLAAEVVLKLMFPNRPNTTEGLVNTDDNTRDTLRQNKKDFQFPLFY